jgi:hypothetical protein
MRRVKKSDSEVKIMENWNGCESGSGDTQGLFGSAISISAILKIAFLKIVFLKSSLFKIV